MKSVLFSSAFLLLIQTVPASSAAALPGPTPSVQFSKGVADQIFGTGSAEAKKNILDCDLLINQTWPYPNAQVTGICTEATTACIRYSLIQKGFNKAKGIRVTTLKNTLPVAFNDTQMKILGCVVAIEATINGQELLNNNSGKTTVGY